VALVVSGSDLPLRGVGLTDRPLQRRADGAVSQFRKKSPVTVRVTTLEFRSIKLRKGVGLTRFYLSIYTHTYLSIYISG